jgi:flagellar FlgN protein
MIDWESELAALLQRLSAAQQSLLSLLATKHKLLAASDHQRLAELPPQEEALSAELEACLQQREFLLKQAAREGMPSDSIHALVRALPNEQADPLETPLQQASMHANLLRHQSLSQWVVVQRTLLHLSQMLEIIATGGRSLPTYEKGRPRESSGSLMDQAV